MGRKSWSKTRYTGKSSKSENREHRKIEREYGTIKSIVELEIQEDDVNKENETDGKRKGYKTLFKNTRLPVTNEEFEGITNKRLLSDNVIHGFNILYRRKFEHVAGLQDSLSGQTFQYSVMKNQKFVHIFHNNLVHWVVISTYNCKICQPIFGPNK